MTKEKNAELITSAEELRKIAGELVVIMGDSDIIHTVPIIKKSKLDLWIFRIKGERHD
jgi:hypothetical protein